MSGILSTPFPLAFDKFFIRDGGEKTLDVNERASVDKPFDGALHSQP